MSDPCRIEAVADNEEMHVNKADFVTGTPVREVGSDQVMVLGGTPERWVCTWGEGDRKVSREFQPSQLERAPTVKSSK